VQQRESHGWLGAIDFLAKTRRNENNEITKLLTALWIRLG
jgi:hypothetical protein